MNMALATGETGEKAGRSLALLKKKLLRHEFSLTKGSALVLSELGIDNFSDSDNR
jgi:hypothetical protein